MFHCLSMPTVKLHQAPMIRRELPLSRVKLAAPSSFQHMQDVEEVIFWVLHVQLRSKKTTLRSPQPIPGRGLFVFSAIRSCCVRFEFLPWLSGLRVRLWHRLTTPQSSSRSSSLSTSFPSFPSSLTAARRHDVDKMIWWTPVIGRRCCL